MGRDGRAATVGRRLGICLVLGLSGLSALAYQTVWLREFRLVFGGSTAATGAVLAVFMGGLGLGNLLLGRWADSVKRPLACYALLELGVAIAALASPWLIHLAGDFYLASGGQTALGVWPATGLRLGLTALVLAPPTLLMGGTLPMTARAITAAADSNRRGLAFAYASNTLGAVLGVLLTTFWLLAELGNFGTLCVAVAANLAAAGGAWWMRRAPTDAAGARDEPSPESASAAAPPFTVYAAAFLVGCVFFLMELSWFRTLSPLLGGTTFTFGAILACALLGIGVGGALYPWVFGARRPTWAALGWTSALQAAGLAAPLIAGDALALWTNDLLTAREAAFPHLVLVWLQVSFVVVFPASVLSGVQFPVLIALLGEGERGVGRHVGGVIAWNTCGGIVGSLLGGLGAMPLLSALGVWKLSLAALVALSLAAFFLGSRASLLRRPAVAVVALVIAVAPLYAFAVRGPTAVWLHSGIGVLRSGAPQSSDLNAREAWRRDMRRTIVWESDGVEASLALRRNNGDAFVVNGKVDGHAIGDAGTQMWLGLLGAILHPDPKTAVVVGLGTGESAGWLADVPSIERVDVIELEPAVDRVAEVCRALNRDVMHHESVRRIYNDAREVLRTTPEQYDVIVSEPSNPYRVGVANLFTREFYASARARLKPGGLFVQWLQIYEIDERSIRCAVATMRSEFSHVEAWHSTPSDLLFVCSDDAPIASGDALAKRVATEPYRSALRWAWRASDLGAFACRRLAGVRTLDAFAAGGEINTDNRNVLEYGFARALNVKERWDSKSLWRSARGARDSLPSTLRDVLDADRVDEYRQVLWGYWEDGLFEVENPTPAWTRRLKGLGPYWAGDFEEVARRWRSDPWDVVEPLERKLLALSLAYAKDDQAAAMADVVAENAPVDAAILRCLLGVRLGDAGLATSALVSALEGLRTDPWVLPHLLEILPDLTRVMIEQPGVVARIEPLLSEPFAGNVLHDWRTQLRLELVARRDPRQAVRLLSAMEPDTPWTLEWLGLRATLYERTKHPLHPRAVRELDQFRKWDKLSGQRRVR